MIDVTAGNAVYYYHFDGLGSVAAQTLAPLVPGVQQERQHSSILGTDLQLDLSPN